MIELMEVSKQFGNKTAVDRLTLSIPEGEFFAFLGPNGAGKTTTIKMMAGLLRPTSGTVMIGGLDLSEDYLLAKRMISYIPDQPFLYEKLSGLEFLHFIANMYDLRSPGREKEIDRLIELFDLREFVHELTESYSHGMKQRIVLAAALLHRPRVVIVDEPLVGLDPHTARVVVDIFKDLARQGTTIFMSTHIISVAEEAAHRIGIILNGKLLADGGKDDLERQYQCPGRLEDLYFKVTGQNGSNHNGGPRA